MDNEPSQVHSELAPSVQLEFTTANTRLGQIRDNLLTQAGRTSMTEGANAIADTIRDRIDGLRKWVSSTTSYDSTSESARTQLAATRSGDPKSHSKFGIEDIEDFVKEPKILAGYTLREVIPELEDQREKSKRTFQAEYTDLCKTNDASGLVFALNAASSHLLPLDHYLVEKSGERQNARSGHPRVVGPNGFTIENDFPPSETETRMSFTVWNNNLFVCAIRESEARTLSRAVQISDPEKRKQLLDTLPDFYRDEKDIHNQFYKSALDTNISDKLTELKQNAANFRTKDVQIQSARDLVTKLK